MKTRAPLLLTVMAMLYATGCATAPQAWNVSSTPQTTAAVEPYRLGPPDVLVLRADGADEFDGLEVTLDADGRVELPLLGELMLEGLTVDEAEALLSREADFYYPDTEISLGVAEYASRQVFVFGEVNQSGPVSFNGRTTVLDALASAGLTDEADASGVLILVVQADGSLVLRERFDLAQALLGDAETANPLLRDGEVVFVPPMTEAFNTPSVSAISPHDAGRGGRLGAHGGSPVSR